MVRKHSNEHRVELHCVEKTMVKMVQVGDFDVHADILFFLSYVHNSRLHVIRVCHCNSHT